MSAANSTARRATPKVLDAHEIWYFNTILNGLKKKGFSEFDVAQIPGLSQARLEKVVSGKAVLTNRQLAAIEEASGLTAGELMLLAIPDADDGIKNLVKRWASAARAVRAV